MTSETDLATIAEQERVLPAGAAHVGRRLQAGAECGAFRLANEAALVDSTVQVSLSLVQVYGALGGGWQG